jgi:hypothetical protein
MKSARRVLLIGGIALTLLGMAHGLWYAVFAEHQALEGMGSSLATGFSAAASRNAAQSEQAMLQYRQTKYVYDREVDAHGHWIGLGLLLMVLAICVNRANCSEGTRMLLAWGLAVGSLLFPVGVLLQTANHGAGPQAIAVAGSGLVIISLAGMTIAFARKQSS